MSKELLDRAEKLRDRFKVMEGVKGSGHHPDDRDPAQPARKIAPEIPLSTSLVPFFDHYDLEEVHFVGQDAGKAFSSLKNWAEKQRGPITGKTGTAIKLLTGIIPKIKLTEKDGLPRLTVRLSEWNDVLFALYEEGIPVSGAPLVHDGSKECP